MFDCQIEWTGTPEYQRFVIRRGDSYWTGRDWAVTLNNALKYETHSDACRVYNQMVEDYFDSQPCREFIVPTRVVVFGNQNFTKQELKEFLSKVCTLVIVPSIRGRGPAKGSLAQVELTWDGLRETYSARPVLTKED